MKIDLYQNDIFIKDPYRRCSKKLNIPQGLWEHTYHHRYIYLEYTTRDIVDFLHIKTQKQFNPKTIERWLLRTRVYHRAQIAIQEGAQIVDSSFFGNQKRFVEIEISK